MARKADNGAVTAKAKKSVGRPTKYDPAFCGLVEACGKDGMSRAEIAAALDVTRETVNEWAKAHPNFSDALHRATEFSLAWWEGKARNNLTTVGFQAGLWKQAMSGRFPNEPYRERLEASGPGGGPIQTESLDQLADLPQHKRDVIRAAIKAAMEK